MSDATPETSASQAEPFRQLLKENWLSLPEYQDAKPLFLGPASRFQPLQKYTSAKLNVQPSQTPLSPVPHGTSAALTMPVPAMFRQQSPSMPQLRTHHGKVIADPFFESDVVYNLNVLNAREFLMSKAAVLVLFYCPHDKGINAIKRHYTASACSTKRDSHAYVTVDCTTEPDLCSAYGITLTPFVAYYSRGVKVDSGLVKCKDFLKDDLRFFMEQAPVYNDPKLKTYGKLSQASKILAGIRSPIRRPLEAGLSLERSKPPESCVARTKKASRELYR